VADDILERLRNRYPDVVHSHLLADAELIGAAVVEIERLRALVDDYENSISWETTCTNCAKLLNDNYDQYCEIERLRAERDAERLTARAVIERLRAASAERDAERLTTRVVIVRKGLHDLYPWWSPDIDGMVDPLADPETADVVREICKVLARDGYLAADDKHEEARRG